MLIKKISKKRLEKELGFQEIDFSTLYFPKYTFQYISGGGNSSMKADIVFDLENLLTIYLKILNGEKVLPVKEHL